MKDYKGIEGNIRNTREYEGMQWKLKGNIREYKGI